MVVAGLFGSIVSTPDEFNEDQFGAWWRPGCIVRQRKYGSG